MVQPRPRVEEEHHGFDPATGLSLESFSRSLDAYLSHRTEYAVCLGRTNPFGQYNALRTYPIRLDDLFGPIPL